MYRLGLSRTVQTLSFRGGCIPTGPTDSYSYQLTLDGEPVTVTGTIQFDEVESNRVNDLVFTAIGKKDGACRIFRPPCPF
jgi:hypothetical protein